MLFALRRGVVGYNVDMATNIQYCIYDSMFIETFVFIQKFLRHYSNYETDIVLILCIRYECYIVYPCLAEVIYTDC